MAIPDPSVTRAGAPFGGAVRESPPREGASAMGVALDDPARLRLLAETELIAASAAARLPTLDRVARLAARATRAPVAQVNLVSADAQVPAAAFVDGDAAGPDGCLLDPADAAPGGAWRRPVGLDASYCRHVVQRGSALVVDDATGDPLVCDNRATIESGIGSYAAAPVVTPGGVVLGTVCVMDFRPRRWTAGDVATLEECALLAGEEVAARLGAASALRESEERLRLAMQAAGLGSWSLELRTGALATSARCREIFGRAPDDALTDGDLWAAVHPADRARVRDAVQRAVATRTDYRADYRATLPDGSERWLTSYGHPLYDAGGAPLRLVGLVQDVTERHLADAERERLLTEAEAANRAKSEFLAVMSHELRTPLNAIGGYAELMEMGLRGPVTDAQRADLARIQRSQRHLLGLINEVLDYAKLETGAVHYDLADVGVRVALAEAEALVAPLVRGRGLSLHVAECAPDLAVRADAEKLRQVLVNLLSNAVKFTERGGHIGVACVVQGDRARIEVRDTGIGIPPEKHGAIFEPFVQVRADLTRTAEGTGLGLAISRDLARGMGGDLVVESAPGAGSTFALVLPLAAPPG